MRVCRVISWIVCLSILVAGLTGCAANTQVLKDGMALADAGSDLSTRAATSITSTSDSLDAYLESQFFVAGLRGIPDPDESIIARVETARSSLELRVTMLNNLGALYATLKNLAAYDASSQVQTAVGNLIDSANALQKAIDTKSGDAITQAEANLLKAAAGDIATALQAGKVRKSSAIIRQVLVKVISVLEKERALYASIDQTVSTVSGDTALALWGTGLGKPDSILQRELGNFGLSYDPQQAQKLYDAAQTAGTQPADDSAVAKIRRAVGADIRYQIIRASRLKGAAIATTIDGLNALVRQHEELEATRPIDLNGAIAEMQLLEHYADLLRQLEVSSSAQPATKPAK